MHQLPQALAPMAAYAQFVLWHSRPGNKPGKTDKYVVHPETFYKHDPLDPAVWMTFDRAAALLAMSGGRAHGVGFAFTENDPFIFMDLDHCVIDGQWSAQSLEFLGYFPGAAIEISQSGTGAHVFSRYDGPVPEHRTSIGTIAGLELYHKGRFAALTGKICGTGTADARCDLLPYFIAKYLPAAAEVNADLDWSSAPRPDWAGPEDDDELLALALASKPLAAGFNPDVVTFADLFHANTEKLAAKYPPDNNSVEPWNRSIVDAALFQHLAFWTGCDCERIERLAQRSALVREKWERLEYLRGSILRSVRLQKDVYNKPAPGAAEVAPEPEQVEQAVNQWHTRDYSQLEQVDGVPFMPPDRQQEFFQGCAWVLDRDQIFTPQFGLLNSSRFDTLFGGWTFALDLQNRKFVPSAWKTFTQSQALRFPRVATTCFRPELPCGAIVSESGVTRVNLFRPANIKRIKGDPAPWLALLAALLPDERDRRILLCYMAAIIQYPGRKFQWWPVLQGVQGNGKTLILTALRMAVGEQYCFAPSPSVIAKTGNQFNSWIECRLLIVIEEIYVPERRTFLEDFKTTVTNEWLPVEGKGVNAAMQDNRANGIMATNHKAGVPITTDSRRYCIFYTAQQQVEDIERDGLTPQFFASMWDWAKGEGDYAELGSNYGYAVFHDFLATYPIEDEFNPAGVCQRAPKTSSTNAALAESRGIVEQTVLETIQQGRQGFQGGWVSSIALDRLLDNLNKGNQVPPNKRREMMQSLGYDWHPALTDGRVNNTIMPDMAKPRLYCRMDEPELLEIPTPALVAQAYTAANSST